MGRVHCRDSALAMLGELAEDDEDAERALVYILRHRLIQGGT